jgi:hypothetical protein
VTRSPEREDIRSRTVRPPRRWWRGFTGSLVAGLIVLTLVVLAAQLWGWSNGTKAVGLLPVLCHVSGSALAFCAQHVADRTRGRSAALAGAGVIALTAAVLWLFWWA